MEKIAIYGLGERWKGIECKQEDFDIVRRKLEMYKIVGFIDQNKCGVEVVFNNERYTVSSLEQWSDFSVDGILITPGKRYQGEIQARLQEYGFRQEQIWLLDDMLKEILGDWLDIGLFKNRMGLEVGGPSAVFSAIYDVCKSCDGVNYATDTIWWEQEKLGRYMYETHEMGRCLIADATDLQNIPNNTYDFILSSNNLEHIANPMKALGEFYRVVQRGGIVVIGVPRKFVSFDHKRDFTTFEHIMEDYKNDIKEDDLTHLPEIVEKHDYVQDYQCGGRDAFLLRAQKNFENRCLHHHVFDEKCLKSMFDYFNIQTLGFASVCNCYWIVGKK